MVQLSHPNMTTGKTIAWIIQTFISKVMSLPFNMLSMFSITFLPRSKCLLISWLQSQSAVILESKEIKSVTVSTFPPSICHEMMGPKVMASGPITSWQIEREKVETVTDFIFLGSKITADSDCNDKLKDDHSLEGKL